MSSATRNTKGETMSYSDAIELLGLTTPKSPVENARLAKSMLVTMSTKTPLRFKVAAKVIISHAK
jgi:hypothetical protein